MEVIFMDDHIVIQRPIMYFINMFEFCVAYEFSDIPDDVFNSLSENDQDAILWFFEDMEPEQGFDY